jgi:hypothetical protein
VLGRRFLIAAFLACSLFAMPRVARADGLSANESEELMRGQTVVRTQTLDGDDYRYVGGVAYTIVDATGDEIDALFDDVAAYQAVLPRTKSARKIGVRGEDTFIELESGNGIFTASYTIRVRKDLAQHTVRFWLDLERPHGIDDAWGFIRYAPIEGGRLLITFGALVDTGPGIVRAFFEERLRTAVLSVPANIRGYMHGKHALARH